MNPKKRLILAILILSVFILPKESSGEIFPQLREYTQLVQERVNSVVVYPKEAEEVGIEGVVKLNLIILSDGEIEDLSIAESSDSSLLDEAAITAVEEASPYPSLKDYTGLEELELIVTVSYEKPKVPTTELPEEISPEVEVPTVTEKPRELDDFVELALENHQPACIAQEQVELARLKIYKAQRDLFPTLVGEWEETDGKTITDPYRGRSYGLQTEQTLFDSGKLSYTLRREKLGLEIAERNYDKIKNELTFEVKKAYYELASAKRALENLKETFNEAKKDLELVKRQYTLGLITEVELLSAQSKYERIGYFINSAEADLSLAKLNFQQALNVDSIESLEAGVYFDLAVKQIKINSEEALEEAQRSRPDIQALELGSLSSEYAEIIAARENRPKVSLVGSLGKSGEAYSTEPLDMIDEWSIMGKVSWLFGGSTLETSKTSDKVLSKEISDTTLKTESDTWSTKFSLLDNLSFYSDKKEAEIAYEQALNELNELQQKTTAEIKDAYLSYQKALSQVNLALSELGFREKELAVRSMRRDLGELPTSEVMEGRIELVQAKSTHIQAIANYYLSLASLNKAIGISDYYH